MYASKEQEKKVDAKYIQILLTMFIVQVCTVVDYVEDLLTTRESGIKVVQKEIGVISPYRQQVNKIRQKLHAKNLKDVTVGSTEEFQVRFRFICC